MISINSRHFFVDKMAASSIMVPVQELFGAVAQEMTVLGVFLLSYALWQLLKQHAQQNRVAKKIITTEASFSKGKVVPPSPASPESPLDGEVKPARSRPGPAPRRLSTSLQKSPSPSVQRAEAQMIEFLEKREFTQALNMYRRFQNSDESEFSERFYAIFIQSSVRVSKLDVAERLLRALKRSGIKVSIEFWQGTMRMVSSRRHYQLLLTMYSLFDNEVPDDKVVFSCIINAALEVGFTQRLPQLLERYAKTHLDIKDYVLFFRSYVALKDANAAEALFRKLGDGITTLMFNLMLLTCISSGEQERCMGLVRHAHDLEKASGSIVDCVSYNTVIKGFAGIAKPKQCVEVLREMVARGVQPDEITIATTFDACMECDDVEAIGHMVGVVKASKSLVPVSTALVRSLVKSNRLPQALELYEGMGPKVQGHGPDVITFSFLIKACIDEHDIERALSLMADMKEVGHQPDDIIFTHLLEGCRHAGKLELGMELFKSMQQAGVKTSGYTLVALLKLFGRCGAHKEAQEVVDNWEAAHGWKPSVIHYTCLMSGCLHSRNYEQAWKAYESMCARDVSPDVTTLSTLLPGMVAAQEWSRVLILAEKVLMSAPRHKVPRETLNNAVSQMLVAQDHANAGKLKAMMTAACIPVTARPPKVN